MSDALLIPSMDPMPLPGPYFLFKLLLLVTFLLHLVAMNGLLGGGVLAAVARWRGRSSALHRRMAGDIGKKIPSLMAATITLGVAPLLFSQALFGPFLYTSSVLMAWPWFSVVPLLILSYYGFYIAASYRDVAGAAARRVTVVGLLLVLAIAFIYSNNFSLMLMPERWPALYRAGAGGWHFPVMDAALWPRYLHVVAGALAIGGLWVAGIGWFAWKKEADYGRALIGFGGRWFAYVTMAQVVIGLWFTLALPRPVMLQFMGRDLYATLLYAVGFVLGLAVIPLMTTGLKRHDPRPALLRTVLATAVLLLIMVLQRDVLRHAYLAPHFQSDALAVRPQWDVLALFVVLFAGGVVVWIAMMRRYFAESLRRSDAKGSPPE